MRSKTEECCYLFVKIISKIYSTKDMIEASFQRKEGRVLIVPFCVFHLLEFLQVTAFLDIKILCPQILPQMKHNKEIKMY